MGLGMGGIDSFNEDCVRRLRDDEERRLREEKARRDADEQLARAARKGDEAAMARLLAEGASPDAKDWRGNPAAVLAARGGHCRAVTLLADAGADLGVQSPKGHTALAVASMWSQGRDAAEARQCMAGMAVVAARHHHCRVRQP